MSDNASSSASGGIGFLGLLAILFIALKLLGYINWSWWLVLAPIWMPTLLIIGILIGLGLWILKENKMNRRKS